jgi:hypothetical protein
MPAPDSKPVKDKIKVTFYLPRSMDKAIELFAARRGWTKSKACEWAWNRVAEVRGEMLQGANGKNKNG